MRGYSEAAWEWAMKVQEVILRAMAKRITWWQPVEILGMTERSMRRWRWRWRQYGYDGLFDRGGGGQVPVGYRWRRSKKCCGSIRRDMRTSTYGAFTRNCGRSMGSG
jgi:hypothetical protein